MNDKIRLGCVLHAIVRSKKGVSMGRLAIACGIDASTVKRRVAELRGEYAAPIASDHAGYHWRPAPHEKRKAKALLIVFCE